MVFKDNVAVITGGAHGFGKEFAKEALQRGMKVVMGDIDGPALKETAQALTAYGNDIHTLEMDVTIYEDMEKLAKLAMDTYGHVDVFFNNAGVVVSGPVWEMPVKDINYIVESNMTSVVYGLKVFIPIMEAQKTECHIVNTASIAGLVTHPMMPLYFMTKAGNVSLTESTSFQLQERGSKIKMHVYCPGFVQTELHLCDQRRPERFAIDDDPYYKSMTYQQQLMLAKRVVETGIPIDSVGMSVFQAIEDDMFYILTHPNYLPVFGMRAKRILDGRNPDVRELK